MRTNMVSIKLKFIRSVLAMTIAICIIYSRVSILINDNVFKLNEELVEPDLLILGLEDDALIAEIAESIQEDDGSITPLEAFLDTMICGKCTRCCSLMDLACGKGENKLERYTEYYQEAEVIIQEDILASVSFNVV